MSTKKEGAGLRLAIDYAPLLVFVAITFFAPNVPLMKLVAGVTHGLDGMEQMRRSSLLACSSRRPRS